MCQRMKKEEKRVEEGARRLLRTKQLQLKNLIRFVVVSNERADVASEQRLHSV